MSFITVGAGLGGAVVVLDVVVVLCDVVLGAGCVLDVLVVLDADLLCEDRLAPQPLRIPMLTTRAIARVCIDTSRSALRHGPGDGEVTGLSVSSPKAAVVGWGEASPLPRFAYTRWCATPEEVAGGPSGSRTTPRVGTERASPGRMTPVLPAARIRAPGCLPTCERGSEIVVTERQLASAEPLGAGTR
jgi:hypothetical protein